MDDLKSPETGCNRPTPALDANLSAIWTQMAGITVRGPLHDELNRRSKFDPTSTAVHG